MSKGLGEQLTYSGSSLDARETIILQEEQTIDNAITNISNAYPGLRVKVIERLEKSDFTGELLSFKIYEIKKTSNRNKPLPANQGGYELIQEPKDLKYSDDTSFLNSDNKIDIDTLKLKNIPELQPHPMLDGFYYTISNNTPWEGQILTTPIYHINNQYLEISIPSVSVKPSNLGEFSQSLITAYSELEGKQLEISIFNINKSSNGYLSSNSSYKFKIPLDITSDKTVIKIEDGINLECGIGIQTNYQLTIALPENEPNISDYRVVLSFSNIQDVSGKIDKISNSTNGNLPKLNSEGNLVDSGISADSILTKVTGTNLNGKLATLDANGNITNSGKSLSDLRAELDNEYVPKPSTDPSDGQILSYDETNETTKWIDNTKVHIKYAATDTPMESQMHNSIQPGDLYIGIYSDNNSSDSTTYTDYEWSKIVGIDGKSAYQQWREAGYTGDETDFLNSLKAHVAGFQSVAYDSNAPTTIGGTASAIGSLSPSADTMDKIVLMPNSGGTATIMYTTTATESEGTTTYAFSCIGELAIDTSDFLSSDKIVQDLNTGGSGKVPSAAAVMQLNEQLYGTLTEQELDNIRSTLTATSFGDFYLGNDSTKEWRYATSGTLSHRKNRHGALDSTWKKLKITANANYKTIYTFTTQLMPDSPITDANELSDYIIEGAYMKSVNVGETGIVNIPDNAKYIYFRSKIQSDETDGKYIPASVIPVIETKEGGDVNNFSEQVLQIQNTITDIGNNVDALDETVLGTTEEVEENGLENPISVTPMNMNNDGYTINRATGRTCYKISVEGAKRLYVKANDVKQAYFLLTTEELPTTGNITSSELYNTYVPHDCDGYDCSSKKAWMSLLSGQDVTIELSESAKYLYWQKNYGSTPNNTPQIITVTRDARVGGLVNEVNKRRDAFVISDELSFSFGTMDVDGQIKNSNNILISNPITLKNGYYLKLDESYKIYRIHTIDTTNGRVADFYCVPYFSNIEAAASSNSSGVLRSGKAIAGVGIVFEVVRKDLSMPNKTDRVVDKFFTLADLLNLGYRQILPNLVVDGSPATEEQAREIYGNYLKRNDIVQRITWRALRPVFPSLDGGRSTRFKKGVELIGINYSETSEWSKYVPQHVSARTYLTSLLNPRSVMYTEHIDSSDSTSKYGFTHNSLSSKSGAYYGTVCTGLTSWLLGLDSLVVASAKWGNSTWARRIMTLIGSNNTYDKLIYIKVGDEEGETSYEAFADNIQPMDFIWNSGHCWSIKAVYLNDDGERIYIVTEQSSPAATESIYHKNELINRLRGHESDGGWQVLRKKDWAGYTPPSDIDMSAVTHNNIQYPNLKPFDIDPDITTFAGEYPVFVINGDNDNSESYNNYKAFLNVHRAQGKYSTLQIFAEDADEATEEPVVTIDISNNQTYIYNSSNIIADDAQDKEDWVIVDLMNIPSPLTAGKYKARVVGSNDTSGFCHWQMVELSFVNNNGVLTFSADDGLTPSGAIPVLIRHENIVGMHSGASDEWKEASELNSGTVTVNWAGEYAKLYVRTDYGVAVKRIML